MVGTMAKLSLGPVLFNWDAGDKRDFYFRIADEAPLDTVYLGEVVCSKRALFFDPHLPAVVERLQRGGKQIVHSTLALIMSEREMDAVRALSGFASGALGGRSGAQRRRRLGVARTRPRSSSPRARRGPSRSFSDVARRRWSFRQEPQQAF